MQDETRLELGAANRVGVVRQGLDPHWNETVTTVIVENGGTLSAVLLGGPPAGLAVTRPEDGWTQDLPAQVAPGTYEIKVYGRLAWPWPFDLHVALYPDVDRCEPNDYEEESCSLVLNQPQPIRLSSFSDVDWFEIEVERPGLVAIALSGMPLPGYDGYGTQIQGFAPDLMFAWDQQEAGHVAGVRGWGLLGYLRAPAAGRYRFAVSGYWMGEDPMTRLAITAVEVVPGSVDEMVVFAMGADTRDADRMELELLAGLSDGRFAELLDGEALAAAATAFVAGEP